MPSMPQVQHNVMTFQLAGRACAFSLDSIREIVHMAELMHPPGLPSFLEGFLNLGGVPIPVLGLRRLLNLSEQQPGRYTPLIIVSGRESLLAFLVDEVKDILSVSEENLLPVRGKQVFNDCIKAEIALDNHHVHLLSVDHLLLKEERRRIAELQAMAQQRLDKLEVKNS